MTSKISCSEIFNLKIIKKININNSVYSDPQSFVDLDVFPVGENEGKVFEVQNKMEYHWSIQHISKIIRFSCAANNNYGRAQATVKIRFSYSQ